MDLHREGQLYNFYLWKADGPEKSMCEPAAEAKTACIAGAVTPAAAVEVPVPVFIRQARSP